MLALRAQQGDRCAFETLARRYRNAVWAVAFLRTGDREEAEDLTQETLLRAATGTRAKSRRPSR
ncbi:MAG TPA: sigma factor [Chthonomonadaceae bacterium]|nr:sigma factor [Chthonomonadaceae bacterium]